MLHIGLELSTAINSVNRKGSILAIACLLVRAVVVGIRDRLTLFMAVCGCKCCCGNALRRSVNLSTVNGCGMTNSRTKGKLGELEAAKVLAEILGMEVRRSQQYSGAGHTADLYGLPGVHVEVKRTESFRLWKAVGQASADASADDVPVVLHRKSREPWVVIVKLEDLVKLSGLVVNFASRPL